MSKERIYLNLYFILGVIIEMGYGLTVYAKNFYSRHPNLVFNLLYLGYFSLLLIMMQDDAASAAPRIWKVGENSAVMFIDSTQKIVSFFQYIGVLLLAVGFGWAGWQHFHGDEREAKGLFLKIAVFGIVLLIGPWITAYMINVFAEESIDPMKK